MRAGKTPLPGVTVTAANTLTGKKFSVATAVNGAYTFTGLPRGRYVVRVEFMGFATQTQEVTLKPETPSGKFDAEMILASRQQEEQGDGAALAAAAMVAAGSCGAADWVLPGSAVRIRTIAAANPAGTLDGQFRAAGINHVLSKSEGLADRLLSWLSMLAQRRPL